MHVAGQLDAVVHVLGEAPEDSVLKLSRGLPRERPLVHTTRDRGDDLGYGQVGHENIIPTLHDFVELVAARLGQVKLQESAGVAVEGAGQPRAVAGPSLTEPCRRAPPRGDQHAPWRHWRTAGDGGPASCAGTPQGSARPCRADDPAAPALRRAAPAP